MIKRKTASETLMKFSEKEHNKKLDIMVSEIREILSSDAMSYIMDMEWASNQGKDVIKLMRLLTSEETKQELKEYLAYHERLLLEDIIPLLNELKEKK